jgi:CBS domain containing-hemolysin-like protein
VSEALGSWWGNPVTAVLVAGVAWVVLVLAAAAAAAVVRLGGIQLGGLLAQREDLLPALPRRVDATAAVVLFVGAVQGVVLLLFAAAVARLAALLALGGAAALALGAFGWLLAAGLALALVREPRVEGGARTAVAVLRPFDRMIAAMARLEAGPEVPENQADEEDELDDHDVQAFIGAGEEAGIIEREDVDMITSVVELSETVVREIMTPRTDIQALPLAADFATVQRRFAESMFTRLVVFRDTLDRIEGVVHVKDVLRAAAGGVTPTAGELLRSVLVIPETKELRELLREFQSQRQQIAVVVDEYGGTSGIVTLEDVLEEIVGEIQDEHQREGPDYEREETGVFLVSGGAHVEVLEEIFDVEIGDGAFDSVAGLVLDRLGHVPRLGEKAAWQGLEIEVVDVDRRRLRRVRVRGTEKRA